MNEYHIYEAVGQGKCSTVYKGRKRKTIEYFACKSVDKSQRSKVLREVKTLHSLNHPNVLKFYNWYETSAHMWLVLEYCVGGDLRTLLKQDCKLPEDSVHDFAHDLVTALLYLHSKGIIYCDLKPSNVLLDENGRIKLCDFGLARRLEDISKSLSTGKRGTPSYMAPELYEDGGVQSYASDLWALGCVLYECYTGRPPFVAREFTQLVKAIHSDPTPPLPGSPSLSFINLIDSLLMKDPAQRIQWPDLCSHAFWKTKINLVPLPPQPAFNSMIGISTKTCLSELNGEQPAKSPPKYREKDAKGGSKQAENSISGSKGLETSVKGTPNGFKTQTKVSGKAIEEKQRGRPGATRPVNILRLSRIAKQNLQRENEKENYRRPLPNSNENNAEVKIENTDMELNFDESNDEEGHDESDGAETNYAIDERPSSQNCHQGDKEEINNNVQVENTSTNETTANEARDCHEEQSSESIEVVTLLPNASPQPKTHRGRDVSAFAADHDSSKPSSSLFDVLWHLSDLAVRPVMPSRKFDKEVMPSLPFEAPRTSDFARMSKQELEPLNNRIIAILTGSSIGISEKQNVVRYLERLSSNADAATILTNGPIMLVLVKVLRLSKTPVLRVQLASLIGLLIRHSTFIVDDLAGSGILDSLTIGLRDKHEKVRRFSMAALGELLFYISTQDEHNKDFRPTESPSKENRSTSGWQVSNALISLVSSVLRKGEDDVTQVYALRTIENICSQGGYWATRFSSQDLISNLCYIYRAAAKQESMRLTAGSCLVRLARFNPPCTQLVIDKLSLKEIASAFVKGNPREQQLCLNLLNIAMTGSHMLTNFGRHLVTLTEEKSLLACLLSIIEQGAEVLRGKALLFVAFLCKNSRRWLPHFFCTSRFLPVVDRLAKEKDSYVQQCHKAFVNLIVSAVPGLLDTITNDIQQLMTGRRQGLASPLNSRAVPKTNTHLFPVVLHLLGSSSFKNNMITEQVLGQLANLTKLGEASFQGRDDFRITLLQVLECIAEDSPLLIQNAEVFIGEILPSLAAIYKGNKDGDARFLCLKIWFDAMTILLTETSETEKRTIKDLKSVSNCHFLPLYPALIQDEDPIPTYAQKLLVMLVEVNYVKISDILHLKTVSQCFEFLLGDLSSANVNNVKLCLALASAPEMETKLLSQLKVVRRIGNLLEYVCTKEMEDFLEPTLGLCRAFLLRSVGNRKALSCTREPMLLADGSSSSENRCEIDPQECIRDISDFSSDMGLMLDLTGSDELNVTDIASECVVLLLKAAPREATTGFLTNLPRVTLILETWQKKSTELPLVLKRILHSLGYSCRQYLSHAMILSISAHDVAKINTIISDMKNSNVAGLADVASLVSMELQRLPRCI